MMRNHTLIALALLVVMSPTHAEWATATQRLDGMQSPTPVASIVNESGYTLAFYPGDGNSVRARFSLPAGLTSLDKDTCPTLQVDRWAPVNRFADNTPCAGNPGWAEYLIGVVTNGSIHSAQLLQLMNGSQIAVRYRLSGGDYRETSFSLAGSKRALIAAIGSNVTVTSP